MPLSSYVREKVAIIAGGVSLEGFVDGDFVTVARAGEQTELEVGTHNEVDAILKNVPNGTITLSIAASSLANDVLQEFHEAWLEDGSSTFSILVKDAHSSRKVAFCRNAIIQKDPDQVFGTNRGPAEWVILCPILSMRQSGALRLA